MCAVRARWHDARVTVSPPSVSDPAVAGASELIGGPWGRSARSRRWLTPLRVVLVLTILTSLLAFLQKSSCVTHPWTNDYQYTRVCYTDVFVLDRKSTRLNSSHPSISYAVFCLKKKKTRNLSPYTP